MKNPKYFICPMSKNIVDSIIELNSELFGLIPTRRQIDFDGGYVNNWDTKSFYEYVKSKSNILVQRDHAGPNQGKTEDDGMDSFKVDSKYFDIIHIDPWKTYNDGWTEGAKKTLESIQILSKLNPKLRYEICTEESIKYLSSSDILNILRYLKSNLDIEVFEKIEYVVIQSGVGLDLANMKNTGTYNKERLKEMVDMVHSFGKKTKEHNGDYLSNTELELRFDNNVDGINIGPEIAQVETMTYLEHMTKEEIDQFYEICFSSKKWEKWVGKNFDFTDKKLLIKVCGHYCFDLFSLPKIDDIIKEKLKNKLLSLP
jgi:hypothetical protein